jgi:UDP-GlcNAc:undecaprenyl-phosphate GlcNAc-1-phosphate transferase
LPLELRLLTGLALALGVVYTATPVAIRLAARLHFYDTPAGYKGHARPTPYLGGAAVMAGFVVALLAVSTSDFERTAPLLGGMAVLWGVGTLDDRRNLAPTLRVAVEVVIAAMLWATDLGWNLGLGGAVDLVLTILWVVAVVNAFNLFDNMDGAASTMALVVSAGVVLLGLIHHDTWLAVAAAALCGACLGFLPHNMVSPARIFLGDGGSMPIGFGVAALVMIGSAEAVPAWQALVVGLLLVGVPALDTALVMVSRRRRGVSILSGSRDHLTHRTQRRLRTARAVAMALGAVQALVSALALFAIRGGATAIVLIVVIYAVAVATAIALLEASEGTETAIAETASPAVVAAVGRQSAVRARLAIWPVIPLVVLLGATAGASPFRAGFYEPGTWVPFGLLLLGIAIAGAIARPPALSRQAIVALGALGGLAVWSLVSSAWAPSIDQATIEANRMFVLTAVLATTLVLVRSDVLAAYLVGGLVAGIGVVAGYVLVHLLGSDPNAIFLGGRLDQPLGYINATGTVFVMGLWLCYSVAGRRRPWLAGLGAGGATLMASCALLTESRGVALAMIGSLVFVLALVPGDRLRRAFGLLVCGAGIAAAATSVLDIYDKGVLGPVPASVAHRAGVAIIVASIGVAVAWATLVALHARLSTWRPGLEGQLVRAGQIVIAGALVIVLVGAVASAGRIERSVSNQWDAFVSLQENKAETGAALSQSGSRLVSGAGTRYDYWRIALDAFEEKPLGGVGAGNYDRSYFKARRTLEDVRQPHSMELQVLSELGIVGALMLAAFIAALVAGAWTMRRAAAGSPLVQSLMVAGVGAVSTWLVHTSVDWVHLMPGVTAIALTMSVVLLRRRDAVAVAAPEPAPTRRWSPRPVAVGAAALVGLALVVAVGSLSRQGLADVYRNRASDALAARPVDAVREANRSLRLDSEDPATYYVKAAALARFNAGDAAVRTLRQALAKEPDNFVTWTLLGDLSVRMGNLGEAKRNYTRASALNPRDPSLRELARDPKSALNGATP